MAICGKVLLFQSLNIVLLSRWLSQDDYIGRMIGTLVNVATVSVGALIGLSINKALPERFVKVVFSALGLFTCYMGISMSLESNEPLIMVLALIFGGIIGEMLQLDQRVHRSIESLKTRFNGSNKFTEGLITAFLLFCVGAMTIIGCFDEGIRGNREVILTKAFMDFFSSTALASAFGKGVLFSVVPLFIYQASLTLAASKLESVITVEFTNEIRGIGGIMLIGLGIQLLNLRQFKLINFLPAFLFGWLFLYLKPMIIDITSVFFTG